LLKNIDGIEKLIDVRMDLFYVGGEGEVGRIQEVVIWDKKFHRGGVKVQWKNDSTCKEYRVGGEGCVDVIYTRMKETASGGKYYPDHLPFVGEEILHSCKQSLWGILDSPWLSVHVSVVIISEYLSKIMNRYEYIICR
jgi:hypothetical protein